ncbi:MAG: MBL fold metallo-hydrolase RNA specificity domain-containing protein [Christensenellales bacterium]
MNLTFIGSAHEVTGSCHYLSCCGKNILVDCGMEQGRDDFINQEIPVSQSEIDYVLLTHAHIDHSGLLPLIYAQGFKGQVITTVATRDLCEIMLRDSAHIQMVEAEWKNRKGQRAGSEEIPPLYTIEDAEGVLRMFAPCHYDEAVVLGDGISVRFFDAGHLLGSASIEITISENGTQKIIVFSGDIGNINQPLIKDPIFLKRADYVVMESTYGDRLHEHTAVDYTERLWEVIKKTIQRGGNVVIPAFAVGRTQELLYYIRKIKSEYAADSSVHFDVYLDSPLAIEATRIFDNNMETCLTCFDEEAMELLKKGINPIMFDELKHSVTSDDSKAINYDRTPKVIISASGMCEAGRIRHHLKHNLWRKESSVLFVGYQAIGTLGRTLLDGAKTVKLFGEAIEVNAEIIHLDGISGHADQLGLVRWIQSFEEKPKRVFIVHGESEVCDHFTAFLRDQYGFNAMAPYSGTILDLSSNTVVKEAMPVEASPERAADGNGKQKFGPFERLLAAGRRLLAVIDRNRQGSNKDLARFTSQIEDLIDRYDQ